MTDIALDSRLEVVRIAVVVWEDTSNIAGWSSIEELRDGFAKDRSWICTNVGRLVHEDDDCVIVSARWTEDGAHWGLSERIPRRAILSITYEGGE